MAVETGMRERTVGVPTLRAGIGSHFAEEWNACVASFPSDGEGHIWVLPWGAGPAGLILPDLPSTSCWVKLGGLVYRIYGELPWKITSQGGRGLEEDFYVDGRRKGWEVSRAVVHWVGFILG